MASLFSGRPASSAFITQPRVVTLRAGVSRLGASATLALAADLDVLRRLPVVAATMESGGVGGAGSTASVERVAEPEVEVGGNPEDSGGNMGEGTKDEEPDEDAACGTNDVTGATRVVGEDDVVAIRLSISSLASMKKGQAATAVPVCSSGCSGAGGNRLARYPSTAKTLES